MDVWCQTTGLDGQSDQCGSLTQWIAWQCNQLIAECTGLGKRAVQQDTVAGGLLVCGL